MSESVSTASARATQMQLVLPMLDALAAGPRKPKDVANAIAARIGIDSDERAQRVSTTGGKQINAFDRSVRWAFQKAKLTGLVLRDDAGRWALAQKTNDLTRVRPGIVVTVFETARGVALWGEAEAVEMQLLDGSVNTIVTSPPYALENKNKKAYGNLCGDAYVDWLVAHAARWHRILADDGSLFVNLGDVWIPGQPTQSLYQEEFLLRACRELGFHLAQRLMWHNPAKLPAPAAWVTVRRVRVTPAVEQVYWLSKTPNPKANNRNVLRPYSDAMRATIARGSSNAGLRPSGHKVGTFAADQGGSIPHSVITASNTASNDDYSRAMRAAGAKIHPARFPRELPEFAIKLTTDESDVVYDPFGGSLTTARVAESLARNWITCDVNLEYLQGGENRFRTEAVA